MAAERALQPGWTPGPGQGLHVLATTTSTDISRIRFVTPAERHPALDVDILGKAYIRCIKPRHAH